MSKLMTQGLWQALRTSYVHLGDGISLAHLSKIGATPRFRPPYLHDCRLWSLWNVNGKRRNLRELVFFLKSSLARLLGLLLPRMFAVCLTTLGLTLNATSPTLLETDLSFPLDTAVEGLTTLHIGTNLRVLEDFLLKTPTCLLSSTLVGASSALFESSTTFIRSTTEIFGANLTLFGLRLPLTFVFFLLSLSKERICL